MRGVFEVNDCLGLCQHVTKHLDDQQAIRYLLSVETLTFEHWRRAKEILPGTCVTNKTTIEGNIKEIICIFRNQEVKTKYLVENLGILPGLNVQSLQLMSFVNSTLDAVKQNIVFTAEKQALVVNNITSQLSTVQSDSSDTLSTEEIPPKSKLTYSQQLKEGIGKRQLPNPRRNRNKPWTFGKDVASEHPNQIPQLKFVCLAVKSGPEETEETLKSEFKKWPSLRKVEVKAVSKSHMGNTFRVHFETPASMVSKWTGEATWRDRMAVKPWVGNPRQPLTPIESRVYKKKIYIGNLSENTSMDHVTANIKDIYHDEMSDNGPIAEIKAIHNEAAWQRQKELRNENVNHTMRKSACVIITSKPGQPLSQIGLKLDEYPTWMRRAVRHWSGPEPGQERSNELSPKNRTW